MDIDDDVLKKLLEKAAADGAESVLNRPNLIRELRAQGKLVQIARTALMSHLLNLLGVDLQTQKVSDVVRDALEAGLDFVESEPKEHSILAINPRFNARIDRLLVKRVERSQLHTTDLFILGLFCLAIKPEEGEDAGQ